MKKHRLPASWPTFLLPILLSISERSGKRFLFGAKCRFIVFDKKRCITPQENSYWQIGHNQTMNRNDEESHSFWLSFIEVHTMMIRPHSFASCHDFRGSNTRWLSHPTRPTILGPSGVQRSAIIRVWPEIGGWLHTSFVFKSGLSSPCIGNIYLSIWPSFVAWYCHTMPPMELRKSTVDTGMPSVWTSSCHTGFPWLAMAAKKGIWQTERGFHLIYRDVCQNLGFTMIYVPTCFFPTGYRFCFSWLFEQTHAWGIDCVSIIISNSATFLSTILGLLCVYIYIV